MKHFDAKTKWTALYSAAEKQFGAAYSSPRCAMDMAMDNAIDSARHEKLFEEHSEEFYKCALNSITDEEREHAEWFKANGWPI